jgi:competence protein ComEC
VLWSEGIIHLDAVVLSHADVDHFNALPGLCERFSIGVVYVSSQMLASQSDSVDCVKEALAANRIPLKVIASNFATASNEPFSIKVLSPAGTAPGSSDNADSLVLRLSAGSRSILLPGDLEAEGLDRLLKSPSVKSDILMLAHHGSANSRPQELFHWCQPEIVVASCGRGRLKPNVIQEVERLPCQFLHTDRDGAIRLTLDPRHIGVETFPAGRWQRPTH